MKKIKIYGFPSHATKERTSGVDFVRILQPMKHLNGYKNIETEVYDPAIDEKHANPLEWEQIMKDSDIFYFNYLNNPWGFAAMGMMARKYGVKLVMDIDDSIWDIKPDNTAYAVYKRGSRELADFTSICNEVDYITCTNDYLRNVIISHTNKKADKIGVFPNYIDLELYKHRSKFKDDGQIRLFHFGSTTHFIDLQDYEFFKGVDKIMKEYPNVVVRTVGAFMPKLRERWGARYESVFGHEDIYKWIGNPDKFPKFMSETNILVVPLVNDVYNRCKSHIKWLEASSAKIPGVWSEVRQYKEVVDGTNGILAKSDKQWYRGIKYLIENPHMRKKMGEKAFEDVKKDWTIQGHISDYARFFTEVVLDSPLKK